MPLFIFIVPIYRTRLMSSWVYARGQSRSETATRLIRWPVKVVLILALAACAGILFVTPLSCLKPVKLPFLRTMPLATDSWPALGFVKVIALAFIKSGQADWAYYRIMAFSWLHGTH